MDTIDPPDPDDEKFLKEVASSPERQSLFDEIEAALVAEVNRQIQAKHGGGVKGATEANEVFTRVDVSLLARVAADTLAFAMSRDMRGELDKLRAGLATVFDDVTKTLADDGFSR